jgi:hypothetical protein
VGEVFRTNVLGHLVSIALEIYGGGGGGGGAGGGGGGGGEDPYLGFISGDPVDSIGVRCVKRVVQSVRKIALQLRHTGTFFVLCPVDRPID